MGLFLVIIPPVTPYRLCLRKSKALQVISEEYFTMSAAELDSFIFKFKYLWRAGYDAYLDINSHAGQAWLGLHVRLGHAHGPLHQDLPRNFTDQELAQPVSVVEKKGKLIEKKLKKLRKRKPPRKV